jgi:hypothetical protein
VFRLKAISGICWDCWSSVGGGLGARVRLGVWDRRFWGLRLWDEWSGGRDGFVL